MIRDRLTEYIANKGISKYQFYKETGLSNGFLDKKGTIGADKCEIICYVYEDINIEWLITGKGNMLKEKNKEQKEAAEPTHIQNSELLDRIERLSAEKARLEDRIAQMEQHKRKYKESTHYDIAAEPEPKLKKH